MPNINIVFAENDTWNLDVKGFGITYQDKVVTNVVKNPRTGEISLFAGNPDSGKCFELLQPNKSEYQSIINQIEKNYE